VATSAPEVEQDEQEMPTPRKPGRSKAQALKDKAAAEAAGTKPQDDLDVILAIETFAPKRPKVRVQTNPDDPEDYVLVELKLMKEFGLASQYEIKEDGAKFQELWDKSGLNSQEKKTMKAVLDRLFQHIVITSKEFPAKARDALSDDNRQAIVTAFTYAPQLMEARRTQASGILDEVEEMEQDEDDDSTTET
jgi:hypothetical protein